MRTNSNSKLRFFFLGCLALPCLLPAPLFAQNYARMLSGVNYQTGTSYTFQAADITRPTSFANGSAVAVTLPSGLGSPIFGVLTAINNGAGTVTITCSSCTINGVATLALTTGQSADIYGDGVNYVAFVTTAAAAGNPASPPGTVQGNNLGAFASIPNSLVDFIAGGVTLNSLTATNGVTIPYPAGLTAGSPASGSSATAAGVFRCDESSAPASPAPGVDYWRCDSGNHGFVYTNNGNAEQFFQPNPMLYHVESAYNLYPAPVGNVFGGGAGANYTYKAMYVDAYGNILGQSQGFNVAANATLDSIHYVTMGSPAPYPQSYDGSAVGTVWYRFSTTGALPLGALAGCGTIAAPAALASGCTDNGQTVDGSTIGQIVGTAAAVPFCSYNVPPNTVKPGKKLEVTAILTHPVGSASVSYTFTVGAGVATVPTTSAGPLKLAGEMWAVPSVNSAEFSELTFSATTGTAIPQADLTVQQTVSLSFNVANTDQILPRACEWRLGAQ